MDRRVKERLVGASILVVLVVLIVPELLSGPKSASHDAAPLPVSAPEPIRNVTVDLATSKPPEPDTASEAAASAAAAASTAAASAALNTDASSAPSSAPSDDNTVVPGGAERPNAEVSDAPAANDGSTGQRSAAGSAANPANARAATSADGAAPKRAPQSPAKASAPTVATLPAAEAPAPLETAAPPPISASNRSWSVQLGSFSSRANADKLVRQLKAQGVVVYSTPGGSGRSLRYRVRIAPVKDRGAAVQEVAKLKGLGHAATIVPPGH